MPPFRQLFDKDRCNLGCLSGTYGESFTGTQHCEVFIELAHIPRLLSSVFHHNCIVGYFGSFQYIFESGSLKSPSVTENFREIQVFSCFLKILLNKTTLDQCFATKNIKFKQIGYLKDNSPRARKLYWEKMSIYKRKSIFLRAISEFCLLELGTVKQKCFRTIPKGGESTLDSLRLKSSPLFRSSLYDKSVFCLVIGLSYV